jgi:hypothetical protein
VKLAVRTGDESRGFGHFQSQTIINHQDFSGFLRGFQEGVFSRKTEFFPKSEESSKKCKNPVLPEYV